MRVRSVNHMIKNRLSILSIIGFLIVIGSAVEGVAAQITPITAKHAAAISKWNDRASSIEKTLIQNKITCPLKFDVQVLDAFGLTDDDPSVALVDYCPGGAYADWIVAMRMEHGQPVMAGFHNENGQNISDGFASGASAMHSIDVRLCPEKKAVYEEFADNNSEGKLSRCGVKAYVWNPKTRTFDENRRESRIASADFCRTNPLEP